MWETITVVALVVCCLLGVLMTAVRLPGTWLIVMAALGYGWWGNWESVGPVTIAVLAGIALFGEITDLTMSAVTARKAGATQQAAWGGLIGGVVGMIFLASLFSLPFPVIGTVVGATAGALVGCFGGAMLVELAMRKKLTQGAKVGLFSALGFVLGMATKIALALAMSGLVLTSIVCAPPA